MIDEYGELNHALELYEDCMAKHQTAQKLFLHQYFLSGQRNGMLYFHLFMGSK